jgi:LysM repeat protein
MVRRPLALALAVLLVLSALLAGCRRSAVPPVEELLEEGGEVPFSQEVEPTSEQIDQVEPTAEVSEVTEEATPEPTEVVVEETTPEPVVTPPPDEAPAETEVPAVAPTEAPVVSTGPTTYVVQPGDNLFRIALRHNLTTQAVAQANNITNPSMIFVGQTLAIPASDGPVPTQPSLPAGCANVYVVRSGDNLFRIALRHNYGQYYLAQHNNIPNPSVLSVGQQICIP